MAFRGSVSNLGERGLGWGWAKKAGLCGLLAPGIARGLRRGVLLSFVKQVRTR
jgi:hypothetical protein